MNSEKLSKPLLTALSKTWKSLVKLCKDCSPNKVKISHSLAFREILTVRLGPDKYTLNWEDE